MTKLTHLDEAGAAKMVDVSAKASSTRDARAQGRISMTEDALQAIREGLTRKGDVLATARIAGIMAAKKTSDLIPLCHPLAISGITVNFDWVSGGIEATANVRLTGQTGVEMEALTAVSVSLLTIYDMVKSIDKYMIISDIRLLSKTGGKSGSWRRTE
jgi:cyclic pyranopterin phosphate synthase